MFFDAHNHLQDDWLAPCRNEILETLSSLPCGGSVVNGTHSEDWDAVASLANAHAWIHPAYGIHPWYIGNISSEDWFDDLRTRLLFNSRASIGEIGIDQWIIKNARPDDPRLTGLRRAPLEEQETFFLRQLTLSAEFNRPATIHCLQAWGRMLKLLETAPLPPCGFLLHAYGGPVEMVPRFVELGAYFSFNASFCLKLEPKTDLRSVPKLQPFLHIPADRLLVETDAPAMPLPDWLNPRLLPSSPTGDTVNHPASITIAYQLLATLRETPLPEFTHQVAENFVRLFGR